MSRLHCTCGNVVRNTVDPSPTEGWLLRDADHERWAAALAEDLASFVAATLRNERGSWVQRTFGPGYPLDASDAEVIGDLLLRGDELRSVAECDRCGRLWIQEGRQSGWYLAFSPDQPGYAGLLRRRTFTKRT
jgi:hypothetical protein